MAISSLSDVTGLYAHYRAEDLDGTLSDTDPVSTWEDQTANGLDLTAAGGARPTYRTSIVNGYSVLRFSGSNYLQASTASDWTFLHDGSDHFAVVVCRIESSPGSVLMTLFDTGGLSSSETGSFLGWENRGSSQNLESPQWWVTKSSITNFVIQNLSVDYGMRDSDTRDRWHTVAVGRNSTDWGMWVDGSLGAGDVRAQSNTPDTGAPEDALTVGERYTLTGFGLDGDIAEIAIWDEAVSDDDKAAIFEFFADKYGVETTKLNQTEVEVATSDNNAFPSVVHADDDTAIVAYRYGSDHNSTDGVIRVQLSTDNGATWGSASTVMSDGSWDYREPCLTKLSDGTILLAAGRVPTSGSSTVGVEIYESDDNGDTWSSLTTVDTGFGTTGRLAGKILEMGSGDLKLPVYGNAGTGFDIAVLTSSDSGATWGSRVAITSVASSSSKYSEWSMVETSSGNLEGWVRWDDGSSLYGKEWRKITSTDSGATWSGPTGSLLSGGGLPNLTLYDSKIYAVIRSLDESGVPARLAYKEVGYDDWQFGFLFDNPGGSRSVYGDVSFSSGGYMVVAYAGEGPTSADADLKVAYQSSAAITASPADEIALGDSAAYTDGKVLTDGFAIAEDFTTVFDDVPFTDGVAFADSVAGVLDAGNDNRELADGWAFDEDFTTVWTQPEFTDGFAFGDSTGGGGTLTGAIEDTIGFGDCFDAGLGELFDDEEILFSDAVSTVLNPGSVVFTGSPSDGLAFDDTFTFAFGDSVTDTIGFADIIFGDYDPPQDFQDGVSDGLAFNDTLSDPEAAFTGPLTDGLAFADAFGDFAFSTKTFHYIDFKDSVSVDGASFASPSDGILFSDTAAYPLNFPTPGEMEEEYPGNYAKANLRDTTVEANRK